MFLAWGNKVSQAARCAQMFWANLVYNTEQLVLDGLFVDLKLFLLISEPSFRELK